MVQREIPQHMQAVVIRRYGTPADLTMETLPVPVPAADEVLVRVMAMSLNRADAYILKGEPWLVRLGFGITRPKHQVPGQDFAGIVAAVGANCKRLRVGDRVFGTPGGGLAEYAVARESKLQIVPGGITFPDAAASPMAGSTALQAVQKTAMQPGSRVLVHGASGGVGSYVVQIAKAKGMHVTASCSAKNADVVARLGANSVLDYARNDLYDPNHPWNEIIDCAGTLKNRESVRWLNPGGVLVRVGFSGGKIMGPIAHILSAPFASIGVPGKVSVLSANSTLNSLAEVGGMLKTDKIQPLIEAIYDFTDFRTAFERLDSARTVGKSVIRIAPE